MLGTLVRIASTTLHVAADILSLAADAIETAGRGQADSRQRTGGQPAGGRRQADSRQGAGGRGQEAEARRTAAETAGQPAEDPLGIMAGGPPPARTVANEIEKAARDYYEATEAAKVADRIKRAARKVLESAPEGEYGDWKIYRKPTNRRIVDHAEVRKTYEAHSLGELPTKAVQPSLMVEPTSPWAD